ncbi:hypothetical protein [Burkholderia sp. Bp9143]|uniref:hypothetical protein n=1 Tax=Burkholderia sp. Bp9143 TaxID=2184574 RepID=UPI0028935A6F|nr:hypothetical protein [Burkholderia sp. Bp9143]
MLHLTNPKAILVWVSIVALSSNSASSPHGALIAGCPTIGRVVFGSCALLFSTESVRRIDGRTRRTLEGGLAVVFGIAGIELLASRRCGGRRRASPGSRADSRCIMQSPKFPTGRQL